MDTPRYRVEEVLLLLIFSGQPVLWWVAMLRIGWKPPFEASAYLVVATFSTCTAAYALSVVPLRSLSDKGAGENRERRTWLWLNLILGALMLAALGVLPLSSPSLTTPVSVFIYAASVGLLCYSHYIWYLRAASAGPPSELLSRAVLLGHPRAAAAIRILASVAIALLATWACYKLIGYTNEVPNHATVFATGFGVIYATVDAIGKGRA